MKKNIGTTLHLFFKNRTLVAIILTLTLSVTGVLWQSQTTLAATSVVSEEEQFAAPYCWKIINPGAKQEIVRIGKKGLISPKYDGYFELVSIQEAIQMGATDAIRLGSLEEEAYVAIVPRQYYTSSRAQPIRVTKTVDDEYGTYVTDDTGARMNLIINRTYRPIDVINNSYPMTASSTKVIANAKINGIKGYVKAPKKATLNAMVSEKGLNDERYFLGYYWEEDPMAQSDNSCQQRLLPLMKNWEHRIDINVKNDSKTQIAKGVRVKCSKIPKTIKKGEILEVKVTLSGSNLSQSPITNTIRLVATGNFKLSLVSRECFGMNDIPSAKEERFVKKIFTKQGALLGNDDTSDFRKWVDFNGKIKKNTGIGVHFFIKATKL